MKKIPYIASYMTTVRQEEGRVSKGTKNPGSLLNEDDVHIKTATVEQTIPDELLLSKEAETRETRMIENTDPDNSIFNSSEEDDGVPHTFTLEQTEPDNHLLFNGDEPVPLTKTLENTEPDESFLFNNEDAGPLTENLENTEPDDYVLQ